MIGLKGEGSALRSPDLISSHLDAERIEQLRDFGPLEDDADRAGDGIAARDDMIGGDGGDIAARGRDRVHDRGDRLVLGDLADRSHRWLPSPQWCRPGCRCGRSGPWRIVDLAMSSRRSSVAWSPVMRPVIRTRAMWSLCFSRSKPLEPRSERQKSGDEGKDRR